MLRRTGQKKAELAWLGFLSRDGGIGIASMARFSSLSRLGVWHS
jgi:hypothetical protein